MLKVPVPVMVSVSETTPIVAASVPSKTFALEGWQRECAPAQCSVKLLVFVGIQLDADAEIVECGCGLPAHGGGH